TRDEMQKHAEGRIKDLKSRGYTNAGIYDPPGVGGTHVFYVLHHADKPEIYAGLPKNPRISPLVEFWKGGAKYAGMAIIGLTAAFGLIQPLFTGASRVKPEDEDAAKQLAKGRSS